MERRACLAVLGAIAVPAVSGCLGGEADSRPELAVERGAAGGDGECVEQVLLDRAHASFPPKLAGLAGADTAIEWTVDLRAGEELYLRITNPDVEFLPHLSVVDPEGTAVIDERPVENIYTVQPALDGEYVVELRHERWGERGEWYVDLNWYSAPGCRR